MKNAFYFMLKALFVKNSFMRKLWFISKFMTSPTGQQIIAIHILPNISRSKINQTKKFDQLIEYNMGSIFLKINHAQNLVEKLVPDPFLKNQNWEYLWINNLKCYKLCFYCTSKLRSPNIYIFYLIKSLAFIKSKKRSRTSVPALFSAWFFQTKKISQAIFYVFIFWDIG